MTDVAATKLYERLDGPAAPRVLDVRNAEEFARWRVEGPHPVDVLNVPYFEFVEREEASVKRVTDWLGARGGELAVVCAEGLRGRDPPSDWSVILSGGGERGRGLPA